MFLCKQIPVTIGEVTEYIVNTFSLVIVKHNHTVHLESRGAFLFPYPSRMTSDKNSFLPFVWEKSNTIFCTTRASTKLNYVFCIPMTFLVNITPMHIQPYKIIKKKKKKGKRIISCSPFIITITPIYIHGAWQTQLVLMCAHLSNLRTWTFPLTKSNTYDYLQGGNEMEPGMSSIFPRKNIHSWNSTIRQWHRFSIIRSSHKFHTKNIYNKGRTTRSRKVLLPPKKAIRKIYVGTHTCRTIFVEDLLHFHLLVFLLLSVLLILPFLFAVSSRNKNPHSGERSTEGKNGFSVWDSWCLLNESSGLIQWKHMYIDYQD